MYKKPYLYELANELIKIIKLRKNVFETINIIVPSLNIEQWFKTYWLKTQDGILMNIKFQRIEEGLFYLFNTPKHYTLLKRNSLKSLIIKHLSKNSALTLPLEISNYLYDENGLINSIKLYDLSNKLSKLFGEYEKDDIEIVGWEKELYDIVLKDADNYNLTTLTFLFDNIKDLKVKNQNLYFFGFVKFNNLEKKIIDYASTFNNVIKFELIQDNTYEKEYEIFTAPSKLREIEALHTKICDLLKYEDNKYSDILVLAPNISEYEKIIPRVFNQDNINFPKIPYRINGRKSIDTNVSIGIKKLFDIYNKNYFTRLDVFELINNLDIQLSRNIDENDVINFSESIVIMNVFRNNQNMDDWEYAKKRILLSKVANINDIDDNVVELGEGEYLPYTNIDFDDQSIVKFVSLIDDLKDWCHLLQNIQYVNSDNILLIKQELDKWFSILDKHGFETNLYYKSVINVINSWNSMEIFENTIPLSTLFYMLFDASVVMDYNNQSYFVKGVTFADFDINTVLSSKHIFFLNASSQELPKQVVKSEIDIREYDISGIKNIENSFFIQYQNAINKFYISYVNRNLKTDEEYYPSTFVSKLQERKKIEEEKIELDETRDWNQLYTKKEYKNKDYYLGLLNTTEEIIEEKEIVNDRDKLTKVRLSDMTNFLKEPLAQKINSIFGSEESLEEDIKIEYEPFELSALDNSILVNKVALLLLKEKIDVLTNEQIADLKIRFALERKIPVINTLINESIFNSVKEQAEAIRKYIKEETNDNYEVVKLEDLVFNDDNNQWVLTCNKEMCLLKEGVKRTYFEIKKMSNKKDNSRFLDLYIFSLMDIASINDDNLYEVKLCATHTKSYSVYPSEASEIICEIYKLMNDYNNNYCLPVDKYVSKKDKKKELTFNDLINDLKGDKGSWAYFKYKKLLDYEKDLGYSEEDFIVTFNQKLLKNVKLIKYIDIESDGDGDATI